MGARLRRSLFSVLEPALSGARVLDVFAGVGALGLEALSRGAASVVLVEHDARAAAALERWILDAGVCDEAHVRRLDALRAAWPPGPFDLVFLDPPFALWGGAEGWRLLDLALGVLAPGGRLVLKVPARLGFPEGRAWRLLRRRSAGDSAWALLAPAAAGTLGHLGGRPAWLGRDLYTARHNGDLLRDYHVLSGRTV